MRKLLEKTTTNNKTKDYKNLNSTLAAWLPPVIWAGVIFAFSSLPQVSFSQFILWDFLAKKAAHLSEYAILYVLIFRACRGRWAPSYFLLAAFALSDELHQKFVPGRTSSPLDIGFDLIGASIASYIIWKLGQIRRKTQKKSLKN